MTSIGSNSNPTGRRDGIVLQGYHKKLKTMKKKYFVLCAENGCNLARLEYYDNEKKFKSRSNPKRTIVLKNCFNINRRFDTKHKFVIALSTKEEGFCIVLDSEQELNTWLRALLALQRGEDTESEPLKPTFGRHIAISRKELYEALRHDGASTSKSRNFLETYLKNKFKIEHVWQVQVQRKGLAEERGIIGSYHVCLTSKSLTLVRIGPSTTSFGESRMVSVEFYLTTIRRCGDSQCFFYMEVGRHSAIGAGELWMETEDSLIAQNMHRIIINAMTSCVKNREEGFGPMRKRSFSANEASKPILMLQRRQTHSGNKPINSSPLSGTTLGRERCDSLPTRNRTTSECSNISTRNTSMPPPRTIPIFSNRPHSMYNNRHSHSPPMNTLSPSTGCSESDGSSLSIDEPDSFGYPSTPDESGNFTNCCYNNRKSETVIPEENSDEFWFPDNKRNVNESNMSILDTLNNQNVALSLPITSSQNNVRKGSPSSSHMGSVDAQGQYIDMLSPYSPCGSSPCDQTGSGFIPISPGVEFPRGIYTGSSGGHSRASSLAEETTDGYVPMARPQSQDYVEMEQSFKHQNMNSLSSAASSCSITSGTPSTDLRFAEYPLDKVKSRFTPDDEEVNSTNERPIRAYSVGSRLEHNKRKLRVDMLNPDQHNSRARAFSVGSRAKVPRSDLFRGVFTPSSQISNNNNNVTETVSTTTSTTAPVKGKKSASAPILVQKSHNSVDRMDDLMEIDFSKNSEKSDNRTMSPLRISSVPVSVPVAKPKVDNFCNNSPNMTGGFVSGYVEMRPGSHSDKFSPPMGQKVADNGYLEMRPVGLSKSPSLSSSPIKLICSPRSGNIIISQNSMTINDDDEYLEKSTSPRSNFVLANSGKINEAEEIQNNGCQTPTSASEGYMEMSWSKTTANSGTNSGSGQNDTSTSKITNSLYNSQTRSSSSPINITTKSKCMLTMSPIEVLHKTPCRNDILDDKDKDMTKQPSSVVHGMIFDLSPGTPVKTFAKNDFTQRKCLVDATNGTIKLTVEGGNQQNILENEKNEQTATTIVDKSKILNTTHVVTNKPKLVEKVEALSNDYADMSIDSDHFSNSKCNSSEKFDYITIAPSKAKPLKLIKQTAHIGKDDDIAGDYAIMKKDTVVVRKEGGTSSSSINPISSSSSSSSSSSVSSATTIKSKEPLVVTLSPMSLENRTNFQGFKPIASSFDELLLEKNNSSKSGISKYFGKQSFEQSSKNDTSLGNELLQMRNDNWQATNRNLSRPNSANSDKVSPSKNHGRPNSANSEYLASISASSSTSTLCGSSSSSSTLCGSKSQSPLAISRPQSFSDTTVTSRTDTAISSISSTTASSVVSSNDSSSRPPSVSCEKELHYASLDLPPSKFSNTSDTDCNNTLANKSSPSTSGESSTSPSPNASSVQQQPTFTYAQIDFNKSESLKIATNTANINKLC